MKLRDPDLEDNPVNAEHAELGIPPVEAAVLHPGDHPILKMAMWLAVFMLIAAVSYLGSRFFSENGIAGSENLIIETLRSEIFWSAVAVGLLAQVIDGALGMAYGI
ncbi:MAG: sulfite exporter TauE/SafE family protein, partial [Candidatus Nitrotoga sp.]